MTFTFNRHREHEGMHAFLSASSYHWLNYDEEKIRLRFVTSKEHAVGTRKHNLASMLIDMGQKLEDTGQTLNSFVNDCIGFKMQSEVLLYFSDNCFGTADAIDFRLNPRSGNMRLRIFDLKTGSTRTSEKQLWVYIALFCLEYDVAVDDIEYDARIYQNDQITHFEIEPSVIFEVMQKIKFNDKIINEMKEANP